MPLTDRDLGLDPATITRLDRKILCAFVNDAVDPTRALKYLKLQKGRDSSFSEFLISWKSLVIEVTKKPEGIQSKEIKKASLERDCSRCCITGINPSFWGGRTEAVHVLAPSLANLLGGDTPSPLFSRRALLGAFLTPILQCRLCELLHGEAGHDLRNSWVLSRHAETAFRQGHFKLVPGQKLSQNLGIEDSSFYAREKYCHKYTIFFTRRSSCEELKTSNGKDLRSGSTFRFESASPLPHPLLLYTHSRFASTRSWISIQDRMEGGWPREYQDSTSILHPRISKAFRKSWLKIPTTIRSQAYDTLGLYSSLVYKPQLPWIRPLPFGLYLKRERVGRNGNEAAALRLVNEHTSIPAPSLIDSIEDRHGNKYIVISRVPGRPVSDVLGLMSDKDISRLVQDLRSCISQLRNVPSTSAQAICGASGGPLFDYRLPPGITGPFASQDDFHHDLTAAATHLSENARSVAQNYRICNKNNQPRFTHGDLNVSNIFVSPGGRLSGLIDWECAGFYPESWEKSKALYAIASYSSDSLWEEWREVVDTAIPGYDIEMEIERVLWGFPESSRS